jgi:predicted flap endonuclease-1-like 5' DNA nuclease
MGYLLTQMFLYILGAFLLGLLLGWIIWGRLRGRITELEAEVARLRTDNVRLKRDLEDCGKARTNLEATVRGLNAQLEELRNRPAPAPAATPVALMSAPATAPAPRKAAAPKPAAVKAAPPKPDNLRRMIGIGPVNNKKLNGMGVTTFAQIAKWTASDIKRVEAVLEFDGRIDRERWIEQAKLLAAGDEKEFLKRFPTAGTDKNT